MANQMWADDSGQWILYTEDASLARQIHGWNAFKDGRIRDMVEYYDGHARPFAVQFRMIGSMRRRVARAAGIGVLTLPID